MTSAELELRIEQMYAALGAISHRDNSSITEEIVENDDGTATLTVSFGGT